MNVGQAATAVAYLTSMTSGWNDDATEQLVYEFERLDDPAALMAAVNKVARTWTNQGRVPLGVLIDAYNHEQAVAARTHQSDEVNRAPRCDGTGWIEDHLPCPTCNPALFRVWNEPDAKRRWRHGVPLHVVLDYDTRAELVAAMSRERCPTDPDEIVDRIDQRTGMAIALDAYRAEYGREPTTTAWLQAATRRTEEQF